MNILLTRTDKRRVASGREQSAVVAHYLKHVQEHSLCTRRHFSLQAFSTCSIISIVHVHVLPLCHPDEDPRLEVFDKVYTS